MKVIFVAGYARSGKDTVADFIVDNYDAEKLKVATPIWEHVEKVNPSVTLRPTRGMRKYLDLREHYSIDELKKRTNIRSYLQRYGKQKRTENPDYFVDKLREAIKCSQKSIVVVSDLRFFNETYAADDADKYVIMVHRDVHRYPDESERPDILKEEVIKHNIPLFEIDNNFTREHLIDETRKVMTHVLHGRDSTHRCS